MTIFSRKPRANVTKGQIKLPQGPNASSSGGDSKMPPPLPSEIVAGELALTHIMNCVGFADNWNGPEASSDYRPKFEAEEELCKQFQGLRDRLSLNRNAALKPIEVGHAKVKVNLIRSRSKLHECDHSRVKAQTNFDQLWSVLEEDPSELRRFNQNIRFVLAVKFLVFAVLTIAEFIFTSSMFVQGLSLGSKGQGYILASSVLGLLWLIPHFGAKALKDVIYNSRRRSEEEEAQDGVPTWRRSLVTADKVLKGLTVSSVVLLIALIVPLSALRFRFLIAPASLSATTGNATGIYVFWWLSFICVVQLLIALSFFWLEWYFYGTLAEKALKAKQTLLRTIEEREIALSKYLECENNYGLRSLALWHLCLAFTKEDTLVKTNFEHALSNGRSAMVKARPEFEVFIFAAPRPVLQEMVEPSEVQREVLGPLDEVERYAQEDLQKFLLSRGYGPYVDPFTPTKPVQKDSPSRERKKSSEKKREANEN